MQQQSSTPPPQPSRTNELAAKVLERFPTAKVEYTKARRLKIIVATDQIREVALFVRDSIGFDHIGTVSGTDFMAKGEIEVVYFVGSTTPDKEDLVIAIAERVKRLEGEVPSLVNVWPGAEFHERETYEMLGVKFAGHPDMRGILLPEDWNDIPPLRKDYVSPGR